MRATVSAMACLRQPLDVTGCGRYASSTSMQVSMVDVREMGVLVRHGAVLVPVRVWLATVPLEFMRMLMMLVVYMTVRMRQRLMPVLVFMALAQVQPDPQGHQRGRQPEHPIR